MSDNMVFWDKVKQPPTWALKKISGGRLNNMTDINPQWRIQALTELFGPCGIGWRTKTTRKWTEPATDGAVFCFVDLDLFVKVDGEWSEAIEGTGGNFLIEKESRGLHSSDEGYKMAETDAISVAAKKLGIAADIYAGSFDGSKYTKNTDDTFKEPQTPKAPTQRAPQSESPLQGKAEPQAVASDLEAATDEAVNDYYEYFKSKGVDPKAIGAQLEACKAKPQYHGTIPKAWLEHMLIQGKLKYGDKVNDDA